MTQGQDDLVSRAVACHLVSQEQVEQCRSVLPEDSTPETVVSTLIATSLLTRWQVKQLAAGRTSNFFLSHYKLLSPLGAGGMGQVFRAADLDDASRQVAIKILPRQSATATAVSRFRREAAAALRMQHDHIVRCFELGQQGDLHFLVMELVDGATLKAYVARQGKLSVQETARIGYEVALALDYAFRQQIVHRDIKPSNILLTRDNRVKVTDLGLAKFFGPQAGGESLATRTGMLLGTIDYLAPEQAEDAKRADIRSDIYSLGCTLYECLTGRPPFSAGTEVQKILAHREQLPTPIREQNRDVPSLLADVIELAMLAKRPEQRFQTPIEVAQALEPWLGGAGQNFSVLDLLEEVVQRDAASSPGWKSSPLNPPTARIPAWSKMQRSGTGFPSKHVVILLGAIAAIVLLPYAISLLQGDRPVENPQSNLAAASATGAENGSPPATGGVIAQPVGRTMRASVPPAMNSSGVPPQPVASGSPPDSGIPTLPASNVPSVAVNPGSTPPVASGNTPPKTGTPGGQSPVYLRDLRQLHVHVYSNLWGPFMIDGKLIERGLYARPLQGGGPGVVTYDIARRFRRLIGEVGIAEGSSPRASAVLFRVLGDGRLLFTSRPLQQVGDRQAMDVDVTGVSMLHLETTCLQQGAIPHSVWIDPQVVPDPQAPTGRLTALPPMAGTPIRPVARASRVWQNHAAALAFDGDVNTAWSADAWPIQWIEADLRQRTALGQIRLLVKQTPPCETEHEIWVSDRPMDVDQTSGRLLHTFRRATRDGDLLEFTFPQNTWGRYVLIRTVKSTSWVTWSEIEIRAASVEK